MASYGSRNRICLLVDSGEMKENILRGRLIKSQVPLDSKGNWDSMWTAHGWEQETGGPRPDDGRGGGLSGARTGNASACLWGNFRKSSSEMKWWIFMLREGRTTCFWRIIILSAVWKVWEDQRTRGRGNKLVFELQRDGKINLNLISRSKLF